MELENKYGNLDDYTIDFKDKKDRDATSKTIVNIIYNIRTFKKIWLNWSRRDLKQ